MDAMDAARGAARRVDRTGRRAMSLALLPVAETMARSAAGGARRNILYSSSIGGGGSAAQRSEGKICSTTAGRTRKTKSSYPVKATMGREEAEERGRGAEAEGNWEKGMVIRLLFLPRGQPEA